MPIHFPAIQSVCYWMLLRKHNKCALCVCVCVCVCQKIYVCVCREQRRAHGVKSGEREKHTTTHIHTHTHTHTHTALGTPPKRGKETPAHTTADLYYLNGIPFP